MDRGAIVKCKATSGGVFISCPVCRTGKLMRLYPDTTAAGVALYCRNCKHESVVDIQPGEQLDRVFLRKTS